MKHPNLASSRLSQLATRTIFSILVGAIMTITSSGVAAAYCGDANKDQQVTAIDALIVLRSAVDIGDACDGDCECDVDFTREITANDALQTLKAAVSGDLYSGCGFQDGCFYDEDCDEGYECGTDPDWDCDAACVPE